MKLKKTYKIKTYVPSNPRLKVTEEFIERNNLTLLRTPAEVKARLEAKMQEFLNFESDVLFDFLPLESAFEFLNDKGVETYKKKPEKWDLITDIGEATQDFLDYMVFAWDKATDERGLSAGRSINKLGAWLWILGREDLTELINDDSLYNPYGAPALIAVCDKMGIDVPEYVREFAKRKYTD